MIVSRRLMIVCGVCFYTPTVDGEVILVCSVVFRMTLYILFQTKRQPSGSE